MKVVVFDLGGTLMQYVGMPQSWAEYYDQGLEAIIQKYPSNVSRQAVEKSLQMLKDFNPRINYRENEYSAEFIFAKVLEHLREKGYVIATLTDLPSAMPDEIFKRDIQEIIKYFDYYVSSSVAGYRKPNCKGLQMISGKYAVPVTELIFVGDEEKDKQTYELLEILE